jgi:hypothetical protein
VANLYDLPIESPKPRLPEQVLQSAAQESFKEVLVIGFDSDGEFYFSSSEGSGPPCLWLLEVAKKRLLEAGGA